MIVATMLAASLVIVTFLFHFWVLRWHSGNMARIAMTAGVRISAQETCVEHVYCRRKY
jgi:hypothetical protein